jgi:hypothetical protein
MSDLLDRSVSALNRHSDAGSADVDRLVTRLRHRRAKRKTIGASCVVAVLLAGGLTTIRQLDHDRFVTADGSINAGGLAMEGTAGDFYELDPSVVPSGWQRKLNRDIIQLGVCTTIEERGAEPVCTETEGPSSVSQIDYYAPGNTSSASAFNPSDDAKARALSVHTMHTSISVDEYVAPWSPRGSKTYDPTHATAERLVIRGHDARAYVINGPDTSAVTWQEAPGLVVTVAGLNLDPSLVSSVAEALRIVEVERLPMPVVAARAPGLTWDAGTNNYPYLLAQHRNGRECVGYSFIEGCPQRAATIVYSPSGFLSLGRTAAEAVSVEALTADGTVVGTSPTTSLASFTSRFFTVVTGDRPPTAIVVRDDIGGIVERIELGQAPLRPSKLPPTMDGVTVVTIGDSTNQRSTETPSRLLLVPARTALTVDGRKIAVDSCFVLETLDANAAWCGKLDNPIVLRSENALVVIAPPGWKTSPALIGGFDPKYNNSMPDKEFNPIGYLFTNTGQTVTATAPGSTIPATITPEPTSTFAQLTAVHTRSRT